MKLHRKYIWRSKKNTLSLLLVMTLVVTLLVALFVLFHTNHRIAAKKDQFLYTAIDYQICDVSTKQLRQLQKVKDIEHLGISRDSGIIRTKSKQEAILVEANADEVLAVSKLIKGRMPQEKNEIVAERWALQNLGLVPEINTTMTLSTSIVKKQGRYSKQNVTYKVVGILNDMAYSKRSGIISFYTFLPDKNFDDFIVTIKWKDAVNSEVKMKQLVSQIGVSLKKVTKNVWAEDKDELFKWDMEMGLLLISIFGIILYGVFRIFFIARKNQYGILKAIGYKNKQITQLIVSELLEIYAISIPIGIITGVILSYIVTFISREQEIEIYFWGRKEEFCVVFPYLQIIIGILMIAIVIILIALFFSYKLNKDSIRSIIFENNMESQKGIKKINIINKKNLTFILSLKYLYLHLRSSIFLVLSIAFGCTLFYGLAYQAKLEKMDNQVNKSLNFFNGDYIITSNDDMNSKVGIKEEILQEIKEVSGIAQIESEKAIPIKVFENGVKKNKGYFDKCEEWVKKNYGFSLTNTYGKEEIYQTKLKGYNELALKKLKNYIVEGNYSLETMQENEVIIAMPRMVEQGEAKGKVGFFKKGRAIMDYRVGDIVEIAYCRNLDTNSSEYWNCQDRLSDYIQKKLKVAAIVYYPYMKTVSPLEQNYPLFIVSNKQYKRMIPLEVYEAVNIKITETAKKKEKEIEDKLIKLAVKNQEITARSIIEEKNNIDKIYVKKIVYIYGIVIVTFILILINLINNLQYRIYVRKNEFAVYCALGMTKKAICKLVCFESRILGISALCISFSATHLITPVLFKKSQLFLYGQYFKYDNLLFGILTVITLLICEVLSRKITKKIVSTDMIEILNSNE
ncbi:ABC transporter permease [Velocimicrobium porci]|uniref:ABC transporter permease n=1 Tax=Velocimicrobium porci TaxID=2606634 RepID=A0A6L5XY76_9FIRM|nr:ABC transporter permease [Velocimicrobium porci]MSS63411.1 ABC transporter permease [Velocimicrobium porci]